MSTDILLVEDDADIRDTIRELLDEEGYRVVTAKNGREALTLLRSGTAPSLIMLDLLMPVMDGIEFLERLRQESAGLARTPVLVMSASAVATAPPGTVLLRKPLAITDLLDAVDRVVPAPSRRA